MILVFNQFGLTHRTTISALCESPLTPLSKRGGLPLSKRGVGGFSDNCVSPKVAYQSLTMSVTLDKRAHRLIRQDG